MSELETKAWEIIKSDAPYSTFMNFFKEMNDVEKTHFGQVVEETLLSTDFENWFNNFKVHNTKEEHFEYEPEDYIGNISPNEFCRLKYVERIEDELHTVLTCIPFHLDLIRSTIDTPSSVISHTKRMKPLSWNGTKSELAFVFFQLTHLYTQKNGQYLPEDKVNLARFLKSNFSVFKDTKEETIRKYFYEDSKIPKTDFLDFLKTDKNTILDSLKTRDDLGKS